MIETLAFVGVVISLGWAAYHLYRLKRAQIAEQIHGMDDTQGLEVPPWDEGGPVLELQPPIQLTGFEVNK